MGLTDHVSAAAIIIELLERSEAEEHIDTGEALDALRLALAELRGGITASDVLSDLLGQFEDKRKLVFELEAYEDEDSPVQGRLDSAVGPIDVDGESGCVVRLDVLEGEDQRGTYYRGADVLEALLRAKEGCS